MNDRNDSLIEIALKEMTKKRKPKTLEKICKDVLEIKGLEYSEEAVSQFQIDFMLSGHFVCCGEDKNGEKLWDLKCRQSSSLLDKDGNYLDDPYDDDDDVVKNELNDDIDYSGLDQQEDDAYEEDDDDDDEEETDDIEEELLLASYPDEDDEEDSYDDEDL